jgi:uncharacterized membrane protein
MKKQQGLGANKIRDSTSVVMKLSIAAVFAALVWVATLVLTVNVPATTGYFNVGETVIYVSALLFGAYVGAFAGGVGAAFADMLVAAQFAPGTLTIKAFEGAIVGFLNKKFGGTSRSSWRMLTAILGIVVGVLLAVIGSAYYTGEVQLFLGYPAPKNPTFTIFVPFGTWYVLGGIVALLIILMGFRIDPESGQAVFSMMVGGLEMVAGYFLYERLALGEATAILEVPVNIGQMVIGLVVALPIARIVLRNLPQLKS